MNAIEFVKKFGLDLAKRDVAAWQSGFIKRDDFLEHYGFDILDDLKQIVDAFWLVEKFGGSNESRKYVDNRILPELSRAINLVERCQ